MEANVMIKCLCYATYGYVMYAFDVLSQKLTEYEPEVTEDRDW